MIVKKAIAGTNLEQAKSHNRRVVIEAIRTNGALSRAAIARLTALSSQTISNIVEELEKEELLRPEATQKGARGQPAVPYSINPDGGYSIGLQLDHQLAVCHHRSLRHGSGPFRTAGRPADACRGDATAGCDRR